MFRGEPPDPASTGGDQRKNQGRGTGGERGGPYVQPPLGLVGRRSPHLLMLWDQQFLALNVWDPPKLKNAGK